MKVTEGQRVIYTKTGTEGKVIRLHELDGKIWAELDTTGLLYEIGSLEPKVEREGSAKGPKKEAGGEDGNALTEIRDEGRPDGSGTVSGGG